MKLKHNTKPLNKGKDLTWYYKTRTLWVCLTLSIYCWACSLSLQVVCFLSEIALGETRFSFTGGYQLEIASRLGMQAPVHFSFSSRTPSEGSCYQVWIHLVQLWTYVIYLQDHWWISFALIVRFSKISVFFPSLSINVKVMRNIFNFFCQTFCISL